VGGPASGSIAAGPRPNEDPRKPDQRDTVTRCEPGGARRRQFGEYILRAKRSEVGRFEYGRVATAKYVYNCLKCGKETKLRFKPKEEYCSDCFRELKIARMKAADQKVDPTS
jgi:CxxC-x17-CxxC domain-containing protein